MDKNTLREQFTQETNEGLILYYSHSYSFNENYVLWLEEQFLKLCNEELEFGKIY